jgi:hypothetical protein
LAYLAGLFDGEGTVTIGATAGRYFNVQVVITNSDARLMEWLAGFGGSVSKKPKIGSFSGSAKLVFRWVLYADNAATFLQAVRPYLRMKGEQADVAFAFRKLVRRPAPGSQTTAELETKRQLHRDMRVLNGTDRF